MMGWFVAILLSIINLLLVVVVDSAKDKVSCAVQVYGIASDESRNYKCSCNTFDYEKFPVCQITPPTTDKSNEGDTK